MAVKKSASPSKAKGTPAPKAKAGGVKSASAAKKETAPKANISAPKKGAGPKKAAPAAVKLSSAQSDLLRSIGGAGETGYVSQKKNELRTLEALRERKLIKRGAKHKESGNYSYQVSAAGKKLLDTPATASTPSAPSAATTNPTAGGNA